MSEQRLYRDLWTIDVVRMLLVVSTSGCELLEEFEPQESDVTVRRDVFRVTIIFIVP